MFLSPSHRLLLAIFAPVLPYSSAWQQQVPPSVSSLFCLLLLLLVSYCPHWACLRVPQPIASLLEERARLEGEDLTDRPLLRDRKNLLNRPEGGVDRRAIEDATDIDPVSRELLLQFHDWGIKVSNPIIWMKQIHEEKKKSKKYPERYSPLFEMFLLHARVNLQKSPPPEDVPSYEEWKQQEGGRRRTAGGAKGRGGGGDPNITGAMYPELAHSSRKPVRSKLKHFCSVLS